MSFFSRLIFLFFPVIQRTFPQTYYKLIIKDNKSACVEAYINERIAKRFDAQPGNCKNVGCRIYQGKQYIPFCCTVTGYRCD